MGFRKTSSWFLGPIAALLLTAANCLATFENPRIQGDHAFRWDTCAWHFGADDGLSGSIIYDISRDAMGYVWICTDAGVSKFDGHEFVHYNTGDGLTDNEVLGIHEDSQGRKWLLTIGGKPCFILNDMVHNPKTDPYLSQMQSQGYISSVFEDRHRNLYLGYFDGYSFQLDPHNRVNPIPCAIPVCRILGFAESPAHGIFEVLNINYVAVLNRGNIRPFPVSNISIQGADNYPVKFFNCGNGESIISWGRNMRFMDSEFNLTLYENVISEGKILGMWNGLRNDVLIGTTIGAFRARRENGRLILSRLTNLRLPILSIFEDEEAGLWIGTEHGLYLYPSYGCRKLDLPTESSPPTAIAALGNGTLLLGFEDGAILEFDHNLQLRRHYSTNGDKIRSFFNRDNNETWIRTSSALYRWHAGDLELIQQMSPRSVSFHKGAREKAVMCITNGWREVDPTLYQIHHFGDSTLHSPKGLGAAQCHCAKYLRDGTLLTATSGGIFALDQLRMKRLLQVEDAIGYSTVRVMEEARDGKVWFGSAGSGILVGTPSSMFRITQDDGLVSNQVSAVEPGPDGGCWVATDKGLQHIGFSNDVPVVSNPRGVSFWVHGKNVRSIALHDSTIFVVADDQVMALATQSRSTADRKSVV